MKTILLCASLALATGCLDEQSTTSQASTIEGTDDAGHDGKGPPPPEALAACAELAADAACAFDIDDHHVEGTCRTGPDGQGPLACAPDRMGPPPEALAACEGADAGAACDFEIDGHDVTGTCKVGPNGSGPLACAPDAPPPQP